MKSVFVTGIKTDFEERLNEALSYLEADKIIDVKFAAGQYSNGMLVLNAIILYKD